MINISIPKFDSTGKSNTVAKIATKFDDLKLNQTLLKQVVLAYLGNQRKPFGNTKSRSEVSGGGRKPYKQKGTGNARTGSMRSPIHVGGGIVFGPTKNRNFKSKVTQGMRKKALAMVLNSKAQEKEIFNIPEIKLDKFSTKEALSKLAKFKFKTGSILLAMEQFDKTTFKSFANISGLEIKLATNINVYELLTYDNIVFCGKAFEKIKTRLI